MPQVDRWVLDHVLDLLEDRPELELFMNLSGSSLADEALLDEMEEMVRARALAPGRLSFEITETAAVGDVAGAREWLFRLKEIGCRFALDDFGIGFSSFSYLQTLPVDYVKIDGSFIRSLETERTNREIVTAIVAVAHTLGKETIAEAVENQQTLRALRGLGVEYGQGWYLGRPEEPPRRSPAPRRFSTSVQEGVNCT
jgi:EAL domain-containing protein (putative c-di-GMP-specific phosphodiesterase class I)